MNISHASKVTGLPAKTIRYYEEIGLIHPDRNANGYRSFSDTELHRLAFLARARALGFSIADCQSLLTLWQDRDRASADVRRIAQDHLDAIQTKIDDLSAMRDTLTHLVKTCAGDNRPDCPILSSLGASSLG